MMRIHVGARPILAVATLAAAMNPTPGREAMRPVSAQNPHISRAMGDYLVALSARRARSRNTHRRKRGRAIST
jgi:hypothetical protein